jgi:hypothetical protein
MRAARFLLTRTAVLALTAFACAGMPARAQVDLYALEAAYIFNFTEFTEWPAPYAAARTLTVCANPHTPLGSTLAKLDGRTVSGKSWSVKPMPDGTAGTVCNVLIVDDASAVAKAMSARDLPILVVRTADIDATDAHCVVTLFPDGDRLRFDIDNSEAVRRHLGLSSKLLRLARNVT